MDAMADQEIHRLLEENRRLRGEIEALRRKVRELEAESLRARRAESKAQERHEQLLSILDSLSEIVYVADPHTYEVLYANRVLKERFGRDPTGGSCYREFQARETPCDFCNNVALLENPDKPIYWEYHNPILGRDFFIVDRLILWPDGRRVRFEMALDVTDMRRRERELAAVYEAAPVGMGLVSYPDRVLLRINPRLCHMLGYREEELLGKPARILYPDEEEYRRVGDVKYRMIEEKGVGSMETRWVRRDGMVIDVLLSSAFMNPDRPSEGTLFTALDITEMKRLREYRERATRLALGLGPDSKENVLSLLSGARELASCSDVYLQSRTSGGIRVFHASEEGRQVITLRGEESSRSLLVKEILALAPDAYFLEDERISAAALKDPVISRRPHRSLLAVPLKKAGEQMGLLVATDLKAREWKAEEVENLLFLSGSLALELERMRREEELRDFIDVAAHELRHPVAILAGYSATLRAHGDRLGERERDEITRAIEEGAYRLANLSVKLMGAARLQRKDVSPTMGEVELHSAIGKAIGELRARGFSGPVDYGEVEPGTKVWADPDMFHDLLVILVENAFIYADPGARVEIMASEKGGTVEVSVLDRGRGIPPQFREKVFERFFQVEDALHHSTPGLGIGLFLAREIVRLHGGRIWNEPREGGGTAFRFTLPSAR